MNSWGWGTQDYLLVHPKSQGGEKSLGLKINTAGVNEVDALHIFMKPKAKAMLLGISQLASIVVTIFLIAKMATILSSVFCSVQLATKVSSAMFPQVHTIPYQFKTNRQDNFLKAQ